MKIEYAARNRGGIQVPTQAECAYAKSKGGELTDDLLHELRTATTPKQSVATAPSNVVTIKKLRQKVERLQRENTRLKLRILTGK
jgi:hypothetical protein